MEAFQRALSEALDAGDVAAFQLRLKPEDGAPDLSDEEILRACAALTPLCRSAGTAFILNDRPDLAAAAGADGVHIGQDDAPYAAARAAVGPDRIVGVTCHNSRHLAMEAAEAGADYVAFGAFHPTATKDPKTFADPELLTWWQEVMESPCVAIGGITAATAGELARAGADFVAVSGAVWGHPDGPGAGVRALNAVLAQ